MYEAFQVEGRTVYIYIYTPNASRTSTCQVWFSTTTRNNMDGADFTPYIHMYGQDWLNAYPARLKNSRKWIKHHSGKLKVDANQNPNGASIYRQCT